MSNGKKPPMTGPKPSNENRKEGPDRSRIANDGMPPNVISQNRPAPPRPKPNDSSR